MNYHDNPNNPNRVFPFTRLAKALGEDEPTTQEPEIYSLSGVDEEILMRALRNHMDGCMSLRGEMKIRGHEDAAITLAQEADRTRMLMDRFDEGFEVQILPEGV